MSDVCRSIGLGNSSTEQQVCRLLEAKGSEPEGYISAAERTQLDGILQRAPADLRPRVANALLDGLSRPGGTPGRVSSGADGVTAMLEAHARPVTTFATGPNPNATTLEGIVLRQTASAAVTKGAVVVGTASLTVSAVAVGALVAVKGAAVAGLVGAGTVAAVTAAAPVVAVVAGVVGVAALGYAAWRMVSPFWQ